MEEIGYKLMEELSERYWWYCARRDIIIDIISRRLPTGTVVDYGCGDGATAKAIQSRGYQVIAADHAEHALVSCCRRGIDAVDLRSESLSQGLADCLILGDVLEHVSDDVGFLKSLGPALSPGGFLLIAVPAYEFLWSGEDYVSRHFRRYRRSGLASVLERAGYTVAWSSYYNTVLFVPIVVSLMLKRLFRPRSMYESDIEPLPDWLNRVLYILFRSEAAILRRFKMPFGASIIAIAKIE